MNTPNKPATHTPGPWHVNGRGDSVFAEGSKQIAYCCPNWLTYKGEETSDAKEQARANCELIASAPTLAAENAKLREFAELFLAWADISPVNKAVNGGLLYAKAKAISRQP